MFILRIDLIPGFQFWVLMKCLTAELLRTLVMIFRSKELKDGITDILEQQTSNPDKSSMGLIIAQKYDVELENAVQTIKEMLKGILESL